MRFSSLLTDDAVTQEIGHRIAAARIERQLTQAQLAAAAGLSKRTVERLEGGGSAQLANLIRCLRVLGLLEGLERLLPETPPNPVELVRRRGRSRVRARSRGAPPAAEEWSWGDKG